MSELTTYQAVEGGGGGALAKATATRLVASKPRNNLARSQSSSLMTCDCRFHVLNNKQEAEGVRRTMIPQHDRRSRPLLGVTSRHNFCFRGCCCDTPTDASRVCRAAQATTKRRKNVAMPSVYACTPRATSFVLRNGSANADDSIPQAYVSRCPPSYLGVKN